MRELIGVADGAILGSLADMASETPTRSVEDELEQHRRP
jgi:hypothetical protein